MSKNYTTIPVMLCEYALVNQKVNHLMLYLYLKQRSSGHIKYNRTEYKKWSKDISKSDKWLKYSIKWLIKKGWITVNSKRSTYRIISYEQLCRKLKLKSNSAVYYESNNWKMFKSFCCAAVITYYLKVKYYLERKSLSVSNIGDTRKSKYFFPKGFHQMPLSYIAQCLGVSNSTANNYKKCAVESGFLEVRNNYSYFFDDQRIEITKNDLPFLRKTYPHLSGRLRLDKKGEVVIVDSDIIRSHLKGRKKRYN